MFVLDKHMNNVQYVKTKTIKTVIEAIILFHLFVFCAFRLKFSKYVDCLDLIPQLYCFGQQNDYLISHDY